MINNIFIRINCRIVINEWQQQHIEGRTHTHTQRLLRNVRSFVFFRLIKMSDSAFTVYSSQIKSNKIDKTNVRSELKRVSIPPNKSFHTIYAAPNWAVSTAATNIVWLRTNLWSAVGQKCVMWLFFYCRKLYKKSICNLCMNACYSIAPMHLTFCSKNDSVIEHDRKVLFSSPSLCLNNSTSALHIYLGVAKKTIFTFDHVESEIEFKSFLFFA